LFRFVPKPGNGALPGDEQRKSDKGVLMADKEKRFVDLDEVVDRFDERFEEYKKFAFKGRIVDTAIAFILGGAFGKMVSSLAENVMMPVLSFVISFTGSDWREAIWMPCNGLKIEIGKFAAASLDFILISLILFIFWKLVHRERDDADSEPGEGTGNRDQRSNQDQGSEDPRQPSPSGD
jgi:large conductance mechanosensitive channel